MFTVPNIVEKRLDAIDSCHVFVVVVTLFLFFVTFLSTSCCYHAMSLSSVIKFVSIFSTIFLGKILLLNKSDRLLRGNTFHFGKEGIELVN